MAFGNTDFVQTTPAWGYFGPPGSTPPTPNTISVGDDTPWASAGWTPLGFTLTPLAINRAIGEFGIDVQQSTANVRQSLTDETVTASSELAELSGTNLALLLQGTKTTTAPGVGQVGFEKVDFGGSGSLPVYALAFEWRTEVSAGTGGTLAGRLLLYRVTFAMDGDLTFGEGEAVSIPFTATASADSTKPVGSQIGSFWIPTNPGT